MITSKNITKAKRIKLSKNFTLWEVLRSNHIKLVQYPDSKTFNNLKLGAEMILQPVRDKFGPIRINSGYRNLKINRAVGGSKTSDHMLGAAFDIVPLKENLSIVYSWIKNGWLYYRQVIKYTESRFIHISYNTPGRRYKRQALIFKK